MHRTLPKVAGLCLLLLVSLGCDAHSMVGKKYYQRTTHQYYGQVVAYESKHDFGGGLQVPAVQVELAGDSTPPTSVKRVWAATDVIDFEYDSKPDAR